jgi:hypothetical protein
LDRNVGDLGAEEEFDDLLRHCFYIELTTARSWGLLGSDGTGKFGRCQMLLSGRRFIPLRRLPPSPTHYTRLRRCH